MTSIKNIGVKGTAVIVEFKDGKHLFFESCWLRDHCRCKFCYNAETHQRVDHILNVPVVDIAEVQCKDAKLLIKWSDDHTSSYEPDFLAQFDYETWSNTRKSTTKIWRGKEIVDKVARVPVSKFLYSTEGAKKIFQSLLDYGVAFIEQVEPTLAATETVCKALGGIQHTLFGGMWEIRPEEGVKDTAYMNIGLPQHTDLTSFSEPAGLQAFHCLKHVNGTGGESVISDGFYAANKLREDHPEDFDFLTTFEVEAEYMFDGHHYRYSAPMIELDKFKDIQQIRFNSYDRSSMAFENGEQCKAYYRALRNLAKIIENPENQWRFKLQPGLIMVFDNFRALHGRTEFTGMRVIGGSYVARTDWLDKARSLKLIK